MTKLPSPKNSDEASETSSESHGYFEKWCEEQEVKAKTEEIEAKAKASEDDWFEALQ